MFKCSVSFLVCVCLNLISNSGSDASQGMRDGECAAGDGTGEITLGSDIPCALGTLTRGETKNYPLVIQSPRARHTITLQPLSGDADLKIWLTDNTRGVPYYAQSCEGPLQTDRVSLPPGVLSGKPTMTIQVVANTNCRYLLSVTTTPFHLTQRLGSPTKSLKVTFEERFGDTEHLLADVAVCNRSGAWVEATVALHGETLARSHIPRSFILGPGQTRGYSCLAFGPTDCFTITIDRTTRTALIYLTCDIIVRLVSGGTGLCATAADDAQSLIPQLKPLARVGALFASGQVLQGTKHLVTIVKKDPKTFSALYLFLKKSGIRVTSSVLSGRILSGFGPISAIVQGLTLLQIPETETVAVQVLPDTDTVQ